MKLFLFAFAFIGCVFSFSCAADEDGWATGYVQVYNELLAKLQAVKANTASQSAKQAIQTVHDDVKDLLSWLRQRDGEQVPITVSRLINDLDALEAQLNADPALRNLIHEVSTKLKQLREQPIPLAQYAEALNKTIEDFKNKLNQILGGGC